MVKTRVIEDLSDQGYEGLDLILVYVDAPHISRTKLLCGILEKPAVHLNLLDRGYQRVNVLVFDHVNLSECIRTNRDIFNLSTEETRHLIALGSICIGDELLPIEIELYRG